MKRTASLVSLLFLLTAAGSASHGEGKGDPGWVFLVSSLVILAALALFIYFRVQETGFFTFLPHTASEEE